jgi:uncharacterized iron-regulated membrane protein
MPSSINLLKTTRLVHLYLGVFTAPALLFFAFTGGVQTFSLHETTRGSDYKPPAILVELSQLHKKQTLVVPTKKPAPNPAEKPSSDSARPRGGAQPAPSSPPATAAPPAAKAKNLLPMKIFFLLVALGLFTPTLTGLYMSYKYTRKKWLVTAVLTAGLAIPGLLLLL